jgi:soluble lytic murein transglycosylase-like protein
MFPLQRMLFLGVTIGAGVLILFANLAARPALASTQEVSSTLGSIFVPLIGSGLAEEQAAPAPPVVEAAAKESSPAASADPGCSLGSGFPENVRRWCELIQRYAGENSLDPNIIAAVMVQESGGNPQAYSHSGAVGLLQVMPRDGLSAAFQCINGPCFGSRPSMAELYNPEFNIRYGTGMLAGLVQRHGSLREALRYYGPGDAGYTYADKVLAIYNTHAGN